jgi:hypothetical protein
MLNTDRFKDREQGTQVFLNLIDFLIKAEGGNITKIQNEEERRKTSYLDTPELTLHQRGFSLRLREEEDTEELFQINLKYRASDRYISASKDLSNTLKSKPKFEEDILPPFVSKFSHSSSVKTDSLPDLTSLKNVISFFPGLQNLNLNKDASIKTVNDFKAFEVVRKLCKFQFEETVTLKASLSFWYLTESKEDFPLVGEFSFDYEGNGNGTIGQLENYPVETVEGANRFFRALQNHPGWLDLSTTTKTAFALEVL